MTSPIFAGIDWSRPWLAHLVETAMPIIQHADWRSALNQEAARRRLRNHRGLALCFVAQERLPADTAYETFISESGAIPTRDNLHDFFNALVWLTFPKLKAQLNAMQAAEIQSSRSQAHESPLKGSVRGKIRDAATIFDENAVLLATPDIALIEALRTHRWRDVFLEKRSAFFSSCDVVLFGHALIEKLVSPYKSITGHARWLNVDPHYFSLSPSSRLAYLDDALAHDLMRGLSAAEFTPLPILGVPDWWVDQTEEFYNDQLVFRPPKRPVT